jgi:hypothetical protein
MAAVWCDVCREQDELTPATIEFRVQREGDGDATPQCVRSHLAPAAVYRRVLSEASE